MATINPDEELLSSIASLSPPLSLKSGTLDLPLTNDSLPPNSNNTPEPTINTNPTTSQSTKSSSMFLNLVIPPLHPQIISILLLTIITFLQKRNIIFSKTLSSLILVFYPQLFIL